MIASISVEQQQIITSLKESNVVVDSVAGSGKTTCSLYIAKQNPDINILLLTYNSKLKIETREKIKNMEIKNMEVHSYHSFCVKYYDENCFTDSNIQLLLNNNNSLLNHINYDMIILDEAQDINYLYYELFCKIYNDNYIKAKICIFGDIKQCIFIFNNADERYILFAEKLFNFNNLKWIKCKLNESFRITNEMSLFINKCLLNNDRIISNKITSNKPRYIICDCFKNRPFDEVKYYLSLGYLPEDIFILAPSIKSIKTPVRILENKIKNSIPHIKVYVPISDEEELDKEILLGKLVFSTFHQTKGLERKVIIIFNFDNSYFKYYNKNVNHFICPNELYVATTRGLEQLSLLHHNENEHLPFINKDTLLNYCYNENNRLLYDKYIENDNFIKYSSPTELIKHIPEHILDECLKYIDIVNILPKKELIKIPLKIKCKDDTFESVSEINGLAIPLFFEYKLKGKISVFENDIIFKDKINDKKISINDTITPEQLLLLSNEWNSHKSGFIFKTYQIDNYNWLSNEKLIEFIDRMKNSLNISNKSIFERKINTCNKYNPELLNIRLTGYIDCIDDNNVYEFKCVKEIQKEHILQLAIYMYQYEYEKINNEFKVDDIVVFKTEKYNITKIYKNGKIQLKNKNKKINVTKNDIKRENTNYYLYNILNDELIKLNCNIENLKKIIIILIEHKYLNKAKICDNLFIDNNIIIKNKYSSNKLDHIKRIKNVESSFIYNKMVIDIETDEFKNILQIAYNIYDENFKLINSKCIYVYDGIHSKPYYPDTLTEKDIKEKGIHPEIASSILVKDINNSKILIGHNIKGFDLIHIRKMLNRYNYFINGRIIIHDTMYDSRNIVNAFGINNKIKVPTLEELNCFLRNKTVENAHNAEGDIIATFECYKILYEKYNLFNNDKFNHTLTYHIYKNYTIKKLREECDKNNIIHNNIKLKEDIIKLLNDLPN